MGGTDLDGALEGLVRETAQADAPGTECAEADPQAEESAEDIMVLCNLSPLREKSSWASAVWLFDLKLGEI